MRPYLLASLALAALIPLSACGQAEETPAVVNATAVETATPASSADQAGVPASGEAAADFSERRDGSAVRSAGDAAENAAATGTGGQAAAPTRSEATTRPAARTRDEAKAPAAPPATQPMNDQSMPEMDHSTTQEMDHSNMPGMTAPSATRPQ